MNDSAERVAWRDVLTKEHLPALLLVCAAVFLHSSDSTLVATLVPAIVADIGGMRVLSWTVMLYEIGSIVAGAASGLLTIRHGIRMPMTFATVLFGGGCLVSALAPDMAVVLLGRVLQGLGGGALVSMSFVSVGILFPRRLMPRVLAAVALVWGVSAFIGPLIGGVFASSVGWRWGFACFSLAAMLLGIWVWRRTPAQQPVSTGTADRFPGWRLVLLCLGVLLIAIGGSLSSLYLTPVIAIVGVGCLIAFFRRDASREADRLLPRTGVSLRTPLGSALVMILCFTIATIAITTYGPLLLVKIHSLSLLGAGYIVACSSVGWSISAVVVSGFDERHDAHTILFGMFILVFSIVGLAYYMPVGPVWLIIIFSILEGVGFGAAWTFILRRASMLAKGADIERIAASMPTLQRLGYATGAAFVGLVANTTGLSESAGPEEVAASSRWIFVACIPFAMVGLFAAFRFCYGSVPGGS